VSKLKSLSFSRHKGTNKITPVISDDTGANVGYHTEHWSGRVDATVTAPQVTVNPSLKADKA